jgi:hypothetical protein
MRTVVVIAFGLGALLSCASRSSDAAMQPIPAPAVATPPVEPEPTQPEPEPEPVVAEPREPNPYVAPPVRQAGDLTVEAPPRQRPDDAIGGRLRTHVDGALSKGSPRIWVGPQVPWFVPLIEGTAELFLLDRVGDELMAFYRDPYDASSCGLGGDANCHYFVRLYDMEGSQRWSVALHELLSAPTYLEVQDIRWADGTLYFNEACQSYASGAKGQCSALVAYDPLAKEIRWRTRPLTSNGVFLIHGDYIVTGYGFTDERDYIHVVRRSDGKIMQKLSVPKAAEGFVIAEDGLLEVTLYPGTRRTFALQGWDGAKPKLVRAQRPAEPGRVTTGRR